MIALSLLNNTEEIKTLIVRNLPLPHIGIPLPDIDWITDEYMKWSKGIPLYNEYITKAMAKFFCYMYGTQVPKEWVFSAVKCLEIAFYIDLYLKPAREERSDEKANNIINELIKALKTGECDQQSEYCNK